MMGKKFDAGEAETIALCAQDADAIFVTEDIVAAFVALSELGPGRVVLPYDLWRWLRGQGLVDASQYDALCTMTARGNLKQRLPGIPSRVLTPPES